MSITLNSCPSLHEAPSVQGGAAYNTGRDEALIVAGLCMHSWLQRASALNALEPGAMPIGRFSTSRTVSGGWCLISQHRRAGGVAICQASRDPFCLCLCFAIGRHLFAPGYTETHYTPAGVPQTITLNRTVRAQAVGEVQGVSEACR